MPTEFHFTLDQLVQGVILPALGTIVVLLWRLIKHTLKVGSGVKSLSEKVRDIEDDVRRALLLGDKLEKQSEALRDVMKTLEALHERWDRVETEMELERERSHYFQGKLLTLRAAVEKHTEAEFHEEWAIPVLKTKRG